MESGLIEQLTTLGPGLLFAAIIFVAYERHVTQLQAVIKDNSTALAQVAQVMHEQCGRLQKHDERADEMQDVLLHANETLTRVEARLDKQPATRSRTRTTN